MYCLETINLSYSFLPGEAALNEVNLKVKMGSIYGFLGANGAGKTTTLKLILGLLKMQQGKVFVFGKPFEKNRVEVLKKTGSIIETPSIYGHLTATENLEVIRKINQCAKERVDEVLKLVGLQDTQRKKAGNFSLGMKQRLGIAIALLNSPELLILDEPTNGLDPNGMLEIRELLKKLNQQNNVTILISSHLLSEIEKLVSDVGIISNGRLLFQGTLKELMQRQHYKSFICMHTDNINQAMNLISSCNVEAKQAENKIILPLIEKEQVAKLNQLLVNNKINVYEIKEVKSDLEKIFLDIIK